MKTFPTVSRLYTIATGRTCRTFVCTSKLWRIEPDAFLLVGVPREFSIDDVAAFVTYSCDALEAVEPAAVFVQVNTPGQRLQQLTGLRPRHPELFPVLPWLIEAPPELQDRACVASVLGSLNASLPRPS